MQCILYLFLVPKQITNTVCDKTVQQPTLPDVKDTRSGSHIPVLYGERLARSIAEPEYYKASASLAEEGFGHVIVFKVP